MIRERVGSVFFWGAFLFEVGYLVFKRLGYDLPLETYWLRGIAFCFGIKILCTKYSRKEWVLILFFGIVGVGAFLFARQDLVLRVVLMVTAAKGVRQRKAMVFVYISLMISYVICILQGILGINPWMEARDYGRGIVETRYLFGFTHANMAHYSFWVMLSFMIMLAYRYIPWWSYLLMEIANLILYRFTASRTGVVVVSFTVLVSLCVVILKEEKVKKWLICMGYPILLVCVLVSAFAAQYGMGDEYSTLVKLLNHVLNNRILAAGMLGRMSSLKLFERAIELPDHNVGVPFDEMINLVDMGFVRMFYSYGILYGILFLVALVLLLYKSVRCGEYIQGVFVIALILYCFIESVQTDCIYVTQCFVWLLMMDVWHQPLEKRICTKKQKAAG